jgi:hypothetical protein
MSAPKVLNLACPHIGKNRIIPINNEIRAEVVCDPDTARGKMSLVTIHVGFPHIVALYVLSTAGGQDRAIVVQI